MMEFTLNNIACQRGGILILEGLTVSISAGEALVLRGPNGSGKTTLLRCIAGLTPQVHGTFGFSTEDVAYAAHADGLKAQMTAAETLAFWSAVYGTDFVKSATEAYDLAPLLDRRTQDMSAGQKRRLSLARLMLTGRDLWALDEPTVSLDAENVDRFARAVEAHLANGGSAVIATHIDLGLTNARSLDVSGFRAKAALDPIDEAFL